MYIWPLFVGQSGAAALAVVLGISGHIAIEVGVGDSAVLTSDESVVAVSRSVDDIVEVSVE